MAFFPYHPRAVESLMAPCGLIHRSSLKGITCPTTFGSSEVGIYVLCRNNWSFYNRRNTPGNDGIHTHQNKWCSQRYLRGKFNGIIHRLWATCRKVLDKNRLDLMASRLRFRQSNRKREIETRCHLSRWLVSETRHVKTGPKTFLENVGQKTRLDFSRKRRAKNETRFFVFVKTCSKTNSDGLHH